MNPLSVLCLATLVACDAAPLSVTTAPADAPQLHIESLDGLLLFLPQPIKVELADGRMRGARFHGVLRVNKDDGELIVQFTDLLGERQPDDVLEQVIFYLTEITLHADDYGLPATHGCGPGAARTLSKRSRDWRRPRWAACRLRILSGT